VQQAEEHRAQSEESEEVCKTKRAEEGTRDACHAISLCTQS